MRKHHSYKSRSVIAFTRKNTRLLLLILLIFTGAILGCGIYELLSDDVKQQLLSFMNHKPVFTTLPELAVTALSSALKLFILLTGMFLLGMTPFGCIPICGIVIFFGFCSGVFECYYYESDGIGAVLTYVLLPVIIAATAITIACAQSLHLSCLFSRQLLPFSAHCGSLWYDFKWYLLRYALCIILAFSAAVCEVILHLLL